MQRLPSFPRVSARGSTLRRMGIPIALLFMFSDFPAAADPSLGRPYTLASTRGTNVTDQTYLGKVQVVLFGFTSCPDICPTTLLSMSEALASLGPERKEVRVLFISVDPERDTMDVLKAYVAAFAPEIVGLTGSKAAIDIVVSAFRARYTVEGAGDATQVSHTGLIYLIDRNGVVSRLVPPSAKGERLLNELRRLIAAR